MPANSTPNDPPDPLDDDRDPNNPNEMTTEAWSDFYANVEERTGMSYDEYMDNDTSMNG